jgi:hypothetical protein
MNRSAFANWIITILLIYAFYLPLAFSQPTVEPPAAAVPEGNFLTAAAIVGSGLYILWLKGRREN